MSSFTIIAYCGDLGIQRIKLLTCDLMCVLRLPEWRNSFWHSRNGQSIGSWYNSSLPVLPPLMLLLFHKPWLLVAAALAEVEDRDCLVYLIFNFVG